MSSKKIKKTVFITGVSGFIGGNLAKRLSIDFNVLGLDKRKGEFTSVLGDLESLNKENLGNVDIIIHLAAALPGDDKEAMHRINVEGTRRLLELSKKSGVKRFIFASTGGIFERGDKITIDSLKKIENEYAKTKEIAGNILLSQTDVEVCILYLFFPYGPQQREPRLIPRLINKINNGEAIEINENGGPTLSFTYIDDLTEQIGRLCLMDKVEKEVIISGNDAKMEKVIGLIGKIIGKKPEIRYLKNDGDMIAEDTAHNITKYFPKIDIEEGLRRTILFN